MINDIDLMCRSWGVQKRRIITGHSEKGEEDGWSRDTVLVRIHEMQEHAGSRRGFPAQRFAETYTDPDALAIHRAAYGMPENLARVLFVHYVVPHSVRVGAKRKAALLNQSVREYWVNVDRAHHWLAGRIQARPSDAIGEAVHHG
jgi:hypothetical protein